MKPITLIGICLILLGIAAFTDQDFTYTTHEKVLDFGPIQATAEKEKTTPLPPLFGGIALGGGILLMAAGYKKR